MLYSGTASVVHLCRHRKKISFRLFTVGKQHPLTFSWAVLRGYVVRHYQARRLLVFPSTASQFPSIGWGSICIENRRTAKLWQSYGRPSISRATTGGIPYLRNAKVERVNYGYTALPTESPASAVRDTLKLIRLGCLLYITHTH